MTSLCGVRCCSNTIFYGQYPTQVKELFLNDILCLKGSFFAFTSTRTESHEANTNKGAITEQTNANCPIAVEALSQMTTIWS